MLSVQKLFLIIVGDRGLIPCDGAIDIDHVYYYNLIVMTSLDWFMLI